MGRYICFSLPLFTIFFLKKLATVHIIATAYGFFYPPHHYHNNPPPNKENRTANMVAGKDVKIIIMWPTCLMVRMNKLFHLLFFSENIITVLRMHIHTLLCTPTHQLQPTPSVACERAVVTLLLLRNELESQVMQSKS